MGNVTYLFKIFSLIVSSSPFIVKLYEFIGEKGNRESTWPDMTVNMSKPHFYLIEMDNISP